MRTPSAGQNYHVLRFEDSREAAAFIAAVSRFLDSPRGRAGLSRGDVEIWSHSMTESSGIDVFMTTAALAGAIGGFGDMPVVETRRGDRLPPNSLLVIDGREASGWGVADIQRRLRLGAL